MDHFAGLDVSVKETSVCIVDDTGRIVREVKVASEPEALLTVLTNPAYHFKRIGLEAGPLSQWLFSALAEAGLPVICVETRHMRAVLKAQINKTDRNDARGVAQMMRAGLYRPVHVKTLRSQKLRMLLTHRKLLQSKAIAIENDLRATLRNFGLNGGDGEVRDAYQGACREPPRFGRAGRTAAHCPAGTSRTDRYSAPPLAGCRSGRRGVSTPYDDPRCWSRGGADLSRHRRRAGALQELQSGRSGVWTDANQVSIWRERPSWPDITVRRRDDADYALRSGPEHARRFDEMVLAQGVGDEDRQKPRDEKGDRGAGPSVGSHHAPHLG
jgi:Transposase